MYQRSFLLEDIDQVAAELAEVLEKKNIRVIALHGEMGAGKTTLTAALLRHLGGIDMASSPTYSIINQYLLPDNQAFFHMDWYRLKDEEEALQAGVEDPLYGNTWCVIEWPEKASGLLPDQVIHLFLELSGEKERILTIREDFVQVL